MHGLSTRRGADFFEFLHRMYPERDVLFQVHQAPNPDPSTPWTGRDWAKHKQEVSDNHVTARNDLIFWTRHTDCQCHCQGEKIQ